MRGSLAGKAERLEFAAAQPARSERRPVPWLSLAPLLPEGGAVHPDPSHQQMLGNGGEAPLVG
jgi:hypothetical protein